MKVFIAGATGVIGSRMVPALVSKGHHVVGTTRTPAKAPALMELGATPVVLDAFDSVAVKDAVAAATPDVVVHELTSIPDVVDPRKLDEQFAETNRLRTEGMDYLLEAARAAGVRRFVAQSFAAWAYARTGGPVKTEADPVETDPPASVRQTLAALLHVERSLAEATDLEGISLRYGGFYGPGTSMGRGGSVIDMVRNRRFPLVGDSRGVWSFIHVDDAAAATVAAIERGDPGVYNVTDDDPASASVWLPELARILKAPPPRHVPVWLARLLAGQTAVVMMTDLRGALNGKAKHELDWQPTYASWRQGFREGLG
ncbi:MAG TPA: NAD(P)-dependent oxidoreductase [Actinomycetota bacterium]|jgi:nucleoside-diphosphate-sugar epimerase|nr:NAD(P)-dependent oxidoreductase [Actinomycetota bacterium]